MTETTASTLHLARNVLVGAFVVLAFLTSFSYAASGVGPSVELPVPPAPAASDTSACACCGGSSAGPSVERETVLSGGVQRISVDPSSGLFVPDRIVAAAGVPIEIAFGEGSGCLAEVVFPDLGVRRDLTGDGAVVLLPAMPAGEHRFSCGMEMVFGTLVVR